MKYEGKKSKESREKYRCRERKKNTGELIGSRECVEDEREERRREEERERGGDKSAVGSRKDYIRLIPDFLRLSVYPRCIAAFYVLNIKPASENHGVMALLYRRPEFLSLLLSLNI